ncbi:MAG: hypothetical protein QXI19_13995 [Candidatus Caldarchaeum sp.]
MGIGIAIGMVLAQVGGWFAGARSDALTVPRLLQKMRGAYSSVTSVRMVVDISFFPSPNQSIQLTMELEYMKPDRIWALLSSSDERVLVISDGKKIGVYHEPSGGRLLNPFSVDHLNASVPGNLETVCLWDWKRQLSAEGEGKMVGSKLRLLLGEQWGDKSWVVLEERDENLGILIKYYIDARTFLIMRTAVYALATNSLYQDARVVSFESGAKMEETRFQIPPSVGEL